MGYINGEYVLNPGQTQRKDSQMDLVVAGTEAAVLMVESEALQLSEDVMLGAVVFGHEQRQDRHQRHPRTGARRRQARVGLEARRQGRGLIAKVDALAEEQARAAYQIRNKQARTQACRARLCRRHGRPEGRGRGVRQRQGRRPAVRDRGQDRAQPDPGR